jgi:hypothetical protein
MSCLETLQAGLNLVLEFLQQQLDAPKGHIPEYLSAGGWQVFSLPGPKYGGLSRVLTGHGLHFRFESFTPGECLYPSPAHLLMWCKLRGDNKLTEEVVTDNIFLVHRLNVLIHAAVLKLGREGELTPEDVEAVKRWEREGFAEEDWELVKGWITRSGFISGFNWDNIQQQLHILKEFLPPKEVERLTEEAYPPIKDFEKRFKGRNVPVIYLALDAPEEMLAQMCTWAYRQGWGDGDHINYLYQYVEKLIRKGDVNSIVFHLLRNWRSPLGRQSFNTYIRSLAKETELQKTGAGREIHAEPEFTPPAESQLDFPLTVEKAAGLLNQDALTDKPQNVLRWLYDQLARGKVPNAGYSDQRVTPEGIRFQKNRYLLNKKGLEIAKDLWFRKKVKPTLAKHLAKTKGITLRAAQKWIKTRLDKGKSLREIAEEILGTKWGQS